MCCKDFSWVLLPWQLQLLIKHESMILFQIEPNVVTHSQSKLKSYVFYRSPSSSLYWWLQFPANHCTRKSTLPSNRNFAAIIRHPFPSRIMPILNMTIGTIMSTLSKKTSQSGNRKLGQKSWYSWSDWEKWFIFDKELSVIISIEPKAKDWFIASR